jgi:hypothetical protein
MDWMLDGLSISTKTFAGEPQNSDKQFQIRKQPTMGNKHSATATLDTDVNQAQRNRRQHSRRRTRTITSTVARSEDVGAQQKQPKIPPASTEYIDALMRFRYKATGKLNEEECPICAEEFEMDCIVVKLPNCGHIFHSHCVVDWLNRKCTCPVCRFEYPTDDHGFEKARTKRMKKRNLQDPCSFDVEMTQRREKEEFSNNFNIILNRALRTKERHLEYSDSSSSGFSTEDYTDS